MQWEDERIRTENRNVWLIAAVSVVANIIFAIVIAILALRPRTLPYLVEVDSRGEPLAVAQPVIGTQNLNDATIRWALASFIHNAFVISPNIDEEKENLRNAMAFTRGQAHDALKAYYNDGTHSPFDLAQKHWQEVHVSRVLKLPAPNTYEVDWQSTLHSYNAALSSTTAWRATTKIAVGGPNGRDPRNPLSLFVTTIDFAPES
jgi:type IV secretory pathway TrbF-like protein